MTLDEFLDVYVPTVLKPMGKWQLRGRCLRLNDYSCPLTAEAHEHPSNWQRGPLGDSDAACLVIAAADNRRKFRNSHFRPTVRRRLLSALGLRERRRS